MIEYFIVSYSLSLILLIILIPLLRKLNLRQYVRKCGPISHLSKQGTPTMGGIVLILSVCLCLAFMYFNESYIKSKDVLMILYPLISFGIVGFIDDYKKISEKDNAGLKASTKIILEIIISILFYLLFIDYLDSKVKIFDLVIDFKYYYVSLLIFLFLATANGFNLSDGMDGLAGGIAIIMFCGYAVIAKVGNNKTIIDVSMIIIASIMAFLCYNFSNALIFMGDVGSLAIGATIANFCIILKIEFLLVIMGLVLIIEALSVIIQVLYFKYTKKKYKNGKRIFLMTPIHHHFEVKYGKRYEKMIVIAFYLIQSIFVFITIIIYRRYK